MKITNSFVVGMLAASTQAFEFPNVKAQANEINESILESISAWNCTTCGITFSALDRVIRNEKVDSFIESTLSHVCSIGNIFSKDESICPDAIRQYGAKLFDSTAKYLLDKDRMCNEVMGLCKSPVIREIDIHDVVNKILATKPARIANDDFINNLYADMAADTADRETIRAVHISDVHIDTLYKAGSKA